MTAPSNVVNAAALTEAYRRAQVGLGATTITNSITLWAFLAENPERNQPTWLSFMLRLVRRDRTQSARYAIDYLSAYREIEGVTIPFTPTLPDFPDEQVITSLQVMGPVALRRKLAEVFEVPEGQEPPPAARLAPSSETARVLQAGLARSAQRHALNGGRDVVDQGLTQDPAAKGYVRVTDGDPCFFCAVLASRGAVYASESFEDSDPRFSGPGNQKVHDGCGCSLVPVYDFDPNNPLIERSRDYQQLWADTGGKLSGPAAIREFRRAYEKRGEYRTV